MEKSNNELIAEFMGWETRQHEHLGLLYSLPESLVKAKRSSWIVPLHLKFDTSWDWLMPVVGKIEDVETIGQRCYIDIGPYEIAGYCSGVLEKGLYAFSIEFKGEHFTGEKKIQTVYKVVVELIKWYRSQPEGNTVNMK